MGGGGGRGILGDGGLGGAGGGLGGMSGRMGGTSGRMGGMWAGGGGSGRMSEAGRNSSQHYEILKLHHMNLLSEIKETTLMLNLYQQHFLQQDQQKKSVAREGQGSKGPESGMASWGILGGYGRGDIGEDDSGSGLVGTSGVREKMVRELSALGAMGGGVGAIDRLLSKRSEMYGIRNGMGGMEGGMGGTMGGIMGNHTEVGGQKNKYIIGREQGGIIEKGGGSRSRDMRGRHNLIEGSNKVDMMAELQGGGTGIMVGQKEKEKLSRVGIQRRGEELNHQNEGRSSQQKIEQDERISLQDGRRSFKQLKGFECHNKGQKSLTYQGIGGSGEQEKCLRKIEEEIAKRRRALMAAYTMNSRSGSYDMRHKGLSRPYGTGDDEPSKRAKTA